MGFDDERDLQRKERKNQDPPPHGDEDFVDGVDVPNPPEEKTSKKIPKREVGGDPLSREELKDGK